MPYGPQLTAISLGESVRQSAVFENRWAMNRLLQNYKLIWAMNRLLQTLINKKVGPKKAMNRLLQNYKLRQLQNRAIS